MKRFNLHRLFVNSPITGLLLTLMIAAGCQPPEAPAPQIPEVTVTHPIQKDVNLYYDFTGTVAPIEQVEIRARVEGFLNRVAFKASDNVEADELLFEIEPETYEVKVQQADAALAAAVAEQKRAGADYDRIKQAAQTDAVSRQQVDLAAAQLLQAEAAVKQAEATLADAKLQLTYTKVTSPIQGRVSRRLVDPGNLVGAGERTLLTRVIRMKPLYVYFNVDERLLATRLAKLDAEASRNPDQKPDTPFYVALPGDEGYPHEGVLNYVDNRVDPDTGTVQVRGTVPNEEVLLYPGMFVRIRVPDQVTEGAILVEEAAIGTDMAGKFLLVVGEGDIVEEIGALVDGMRVIREGVTTAERYVVNGLLRARPGLPVKPKTAGEKPAVPAAAPQGGDPNDQ
jgi:RND family efflux transporter MFP subunit